MSIPTLYFFQWCSSTMVMIINTTIIMGKANRVIVEKIDSITAIIPPLRKRV